MNATAPSVIQLDRATLAGPHKLRLEFADGKVTTVAFGPFLRASRHPDLRRYLKKENFSRFVVEDGQLHWDDFDLVFPLAQLYEGKIAIKSAETQAPAPRRLDSAPPLRREWRLARKFFPLRRGLLGPWPDEKATQFAHGFISWPRVGISQCFNSRT